MKIDTRHADKRWGRGRLLQLAIRKFHDHIYGHDWTPWHYDWPEDIVEPPDERQLLLWIRTCGHRDCGTHQLAYACLHEAHRLPGKTRGSVFNPAQPVHD